MPCLVAAPDKFRGTASAHEAADAVARAAVARGWGADARPMSDGGEGFLDALGGEVRTATVRGPLGAPVVARWILRVDGTALLESAEAVGRARLPAPAGDDPVRASTHGVGELVATALRAKATSIVVGCGGTSTTDGGEGCVEALVAAGMTVDVPLLVACDVDVTFTSAASGFGPQKGATPDQVRELEARLHELAARYLERFGVDVTEVRGAGAAGGLAGGLVALGGTVVGGAAYVAGAIGLDAVLEGADLVVTGEGRLDDQTLAGKVVATVLALRPAMPGLVVAGHADAAAAAALAAHREGTVAVVELDERVQGRDGTIGAITSAVRDALAALA